MYMEDAVSVPAFLSSLFLSPIVKLGGGGTSESLCLFRFVKMLPSEPLKLLQLTCVGLWSASMLCVKSLGWRWQSCVEVQLSETWLSHIFHTAVPFTNRCGVLVKGHQYHFQCFGCRLNCPEVTLCGWQDVKLQLLTNLLFEGQVDNQ